MKISKWLYWTPRALGIIFVIFLSLFSLDVFETASGFWEIFFALFLHNIPAIILLIFLIISWKHELVGAVVFSLAGIIYLIWIIITSLTNSFEWFYFVWVLQITGPAFIVAVLFYLNWKKKTKH